MTSHPHYNQRTINKFEDLLYTRKCYLVCYCVKLGKAWWINCSLHLESMFIMVPACTCTWEMSRSYSFISWLAMLPSVRFPVMSSTYSLSCVWQSGCACHLGWLRSPPTYHPCIVTVPACSKPWDYLKYENYITFQISILIIMFFSFKNWNHPLLQEKQQQ